MILIWFADEELVGIQRDHRVVAECFIKPKGKEGVGAFAANVFYEAHSY